MAIDYSKWDKLELSDDSDIEVHPNVDKKSFIRWRQRDIHEKRAMRKQKMADIRAASDMNRRLASRIQELIHHVQGLSDSDNALQACSEYLDQHAAEDAEKAIEGGASYHEMLKSLLSQIQKDVSSASREDSLALGKKSIEDQLGKHSSRLKELLEKAQKEYEQLEEESKRYITSEDIHIGFDNTIVTKAPPSKPKGAKKEKVQVIETLNADSVQDEQAGSSAAAAAAEEPEDDEEDLEELTVSEAGKEFAQLGSADYRKSESFILSHLEILARPSESDSLLMEAFNAEMDGRSAFAMQCVRQALLLQYCRQLGASSISVFFNKIEQADGRARGLFENDVAQTYERVHTRATALAREQLERGEAVEQIQLCAVDPNTTINIIVPRADSEDAEERAAREVFDSFPLDLQEALATNNLDTINKVLGEMKVTDAEEVVEKLSQSGILSIEEGIIDTTKGETIPQPDA
ncbi:hsp90-like protein [Schizosaccharomyces japonicus yFS275]|uniref:Hsp90 chaperone protein kinase-targeting subunit n=1 Tax=Schizosaccharomyces japonicus (strain yFS275 / FY16936) TaxID=402676 RepID=B6K715_SCHJY|nr:hsp90-like protein [Schizosaccharomyces japonicus yFS275]EEB09319.1 hsp90-like protein [Schizosaccharomyces japonicus yFS275]